METFTFDWWWRIHQSLARIFRFCVMFWTNEREPTIKCCLGGQVDVVQKFITIQNFGHNWWWANGIRVEYLPRIHYIAAPQKSPRVLLKNERKTRIIYKTDHLHVDVQRHLREISRQGTGMRIKRQTRFYLCDFHQEDDQSSDLGQKRSGILLMIANHKENGTELPNKWWLNSQKAGTQSSVPRVHCPEERSKAKVVENYQYTSALMKERLKLLFAQLCWSAQCLRSSLRFVWRTQSLPCKNGETVMVGQSDPLFVPTSSSLKTPAPSTDDPAQENLLQKVPRTSGKTITTKSCDKVLYWCRIPDNGWRRTVLHDKRHWRILTIYRINRLSWVHLATRWKIIWPDRLDSREH